MMGGLPFLDYSLFGLRDQVTSTHPRALETLG